MILGVGASDLVDFGLKVWWREAGSAILECRETLQIRCSSWVSGVTDFADSASEAELLRDDLELICGLFRGRGQVLVAAAQDQ